MEITVNSYKEIVYNSDYDLYSEENATACEEIELFIADNDFVRTAEPLCGRPVTDVWINSTEGYKITRTYNYNRQPHEKNSWSLASTKLTIDGLDG